VAAHRADVPRGGRRLLVTGGSGRLARRVIERILAKSSDHVITTTRTPDKLVDLARRGVEVRYADHDDVASLEAAFAGPDRMLAISASAVGRRAEQMRAVVQAAKQAGVRHFCYTSTLAPKPSARDPIDNDHFWSEAAIFASGMTWTILRHAMYSEHIFLSLPIAVASGRLVSVMGLFGRAYVTREDCARADAGALMAEDEERRIYDVTGPAVVTQRELAALGSELTGRRIVHIDGSADDVRKAWLAAGMAPPLVEGLLSYDLFAANGGHHVRSNAVQRLGGEEPESVSRFLERHKDALLPDADGRVKLDIHGPG
jgi:NAD(P)H dehydrogenase (quinone)